MNLQDLANLEDIQKLKEAHAAAEKNGEKNFKISLSAGTAEFFTPYAEYLIKYLEEVVPK